MRVADVRGAAAAGRSRASRSRAAGHTALHAARIQVPVHDGADPQHERSSRLVPGRTPACAGHRQVGRPTIVPCVLGVPHAEREGQTGERADRRPAEELLIRQLREFKSGVRDTATSQAEGHAGNHAGHDRGRHGTCSPLTFRRCPGRPGFASSKRTSFRKSVWRGRRSIWSATALANQSACGSSRRTRTRSLSGCGPRTPAGSRTCPSGRSRKVKRS